MDQFGDMLDARLDPRSGYSAVHIDLGAGLEFMLSPKAAIEFGQKIIAAAIVAEMLEGKRK